MPERSQQVRQQAREAEADEHERDQELLGVVGGVAGRRAQRRPDHADHDRADGNVLVAAGPLAEHVLADQQQGQQAARESRLDDDEGSEQQRHHLQRPAEDRQARAEQPARALYEAPEEGQPQMLLLGRLSGVHRLQGDP